MVLWTTLVLFAITILAFRITIPLIKKRQLVLYVREEGPDMHGYKQGTPSVGGLIFLPLFLAAYSFYQLWHPTPYYLPVFYGGLLFGSIGFMDDFLKINRKNARGLPARYKLFLQFLSCLIVLFILYPTQPTSSVSIPFSGGMIWDMGWLYYPFFFLFLTGFSNATNLTDGLDGLAGGASIITCVAAFVFFTLQDVHDPTLLFLAAVLLAFLWFNTKPAKIIMGDTGALGLGGILGVYALSSKSPFLFFVFGFVFWMETLSVVLQVCSYKIRKKRIFLMSPIHHHFELLGWPETLVVGRFWVIQLVACILAFAS